MMSVQEVKATIERVQPHISAFDPGPGRNLNMDAPANNHETSTRYLIIDPVLRSLGWDLSDPGDCVVEYKVSPPSLRAVDYALLDGRGNSAVPGGSKTYRRPHGKRRELGAGLWLHAGSPYSEGRRGDQRPVLGHTDSEPGRSLASRERPASGTPLAGSGRNRGPTPSPPG